MDSPKMLRAVSFAPGQMLQAGRTSFALVMEDQEGKKYYTVFAARNNYVEGILKSINRLAPAQFPVNNIPASHTAGTDGREPDDGKIMEGAVEE